MYAAGSKEEKGAGGSLHGGTIAHLFVFCKGGVAGASDSGVRPPMGTDGFVLACALHQRRVWLGGRPAVWLGVRRYPARSALQRIWKQGDSLYPRRGLRPLHPAWGWDGAAACVGASGRFLAFRWVRGEGEGGWGRGFPRVWGMGRGGRGGGLRSGGCWGGFFARRVANGGDVSLLNQEGSWVCLNPSGFWVVSQFGILLGSD